MTRDTSRVDVTRTETVAVDPDVVDRRDVLDDDRLAPVDVARSDLVSWSSIIAGVLAAFGLFVLLSAIALAAGLEADSPRFGREVGLIITGLFGVLAFLAGGFIATWTADVEEQESAIMHGFLVWALFVVLLLAMIAAGLGTALGSVGNVFSGAFAAPNQEELSDAAWGSVFALVIAVASCILGALLGPNDQVRRRMGFARRD
jgi:hypothetical protein